VNNTKPLDIETWWKKYNSSIIWLFSILIFILTIFTSHDYTKPYTNLAAFGATQIILLGLIVVLLLYRYMSKIKFGGFEIEFNELEKKLKNANKLMSDIQSLVTNREFDEAKSEIDKAIGIADIIKLKLRYS